MINDLQPGAWITADGVSLMVVTPNLPENGFRAVAEVFTPQTAIAAALSKDRTLAFVQRTIMTGGSSRTFLKTQDDIGKDVDTVLKVEHWFTVDNLTYAMSVLGKRLRNPLFSNVNAAMLVIPADRELHLVIPQRGAYSTLTGEKYHLPVDFGVVLPVWKLVNLNPIMTLDIKTGGGNA